MTKTMKKILQYLLVAIFSLTLVLGVGNVINNNKTAQAATTTQVTTVSSLDLSNQATAQVYINNGWLKEGSYDATEGAPKVDLSKGHAMLYLSPASWAFSFLPGIPTGIPPSPRRKLLRCRIRPPAGRFLRKLKP